MICCAGTWTSRGCVTVYPTRHRMGYLTWSANEYNYCELHLVSLCMTDSCYNTQNMIQSPRSHHEAVAACCAVEGEVRVLRPHVHDVEVVLVAVQLLEAGLDGLRAGAVPAPRVAHQHQHARLAAARCAATPRPVERPHLCGTRRAPATMLQNITEPVWVVPFRCNDVDHTLQVPLARD